MRDYFYSLADSITAQLKTGEIFTCLLRGEDSDFVRLNKTRIRQAGRVHQLELALDLIEGQRHAAAHINLSGNLEHDRSVVGDLINTLRSQRSLLEVDPYLLFATQVHNTEQVHACALPQVKTVVPEIIEIVSDLELVGIWASGTQYQGFANSFGQRNWYSAQSFNFDWSCYFEGGNAVKSNYSGTEWDLARFRRNIANIRLQGQRYSKPAHSPRLSNYRVYLAPTALQEILALVAWGGFSLKSHRTLQTPLIKMIQQNQRLHTRVNLIENNSRGLVSGFTPGGFIKPDQVSLIQAGQYQDCLVEPRSSREFGVPVNASFEVPESMEMSGGGLNEADILKLLDTGLYINNLWYCNFSDRNNCRITGMTRFACFWVESGELIAPLNAMRFDESIYRLLGDNLIGLTREQSTLIDPGTYQRRSTSSMKLPGALVEDFTITL